MITLEFEQAKGLPASARFAYVTDDFAEAYVFYPGNARERKGAFLAATFDGVGLVRGYRGQLYFPVGWLSREYPKWSDDLLAMKAKLFERAKTENDGQLPAV